MATIKRHSKLIWVSHLRTQVESSALKDLPNYGQFPVTLSDTQRENIKLLNEASGGTFRRSCDIHLKELGNLEVKVIGFQSKAMALQGLIGRRLEKIQDATAKGPSNDFADAMDKFTRVLKGIVTEFDEFQEEREAFYLELIKREMYICLVLGEVLPL
ncbi:MAG: hypothetical protein Q9180_008981 [Flavoplaca navasiana]